jgi:hypothetical protein
MGDLNWSNSLYFYFATCRSSRRTNRFSMFSVACPRCANHHKKSKVGILRLCGSMSGPLSNTRDGDDPQCHGHLPPHSWYKTFLVHRLTLEKSDLVKNPITVSVQSGRLRTPALVVRDGVSQELILLLGPVVALLRPSILALHYLVHPSGHSIDDLLISTPNWHWSTVLLR